MCHALVAVFALGLLACGSDDADPPAATTTEPTGAPADTTAASDTTVAPSDDAAAFCAINDEIDALFGDAEEPQALIDAANQALALTPDLVAEAPEEIAGDVDVIVTATEAVAAGDPAGFATVEFQDATAAVNDLCGV